MNLWLRLLWLLLTVKRRPALTPPHEVSRLHFRVWPHDLDPNLHMNNGRYLTIMDLGRLDYVLRSGLWRPVRAHGWAPMLGGAVIRFRRELRPFARFRLDTRIVAWSDTIGVMEQTFVLQSSAGREVIAARALVKAGFYDRQTRSFVPIKRLIEALGVPPEASISPRPSPEVEAFLAADRSLRPLGQGGDVSM